MARPDAALLDAARYPFAHTITTRFADIDPNQHLNNVALAAMMEDARVRFNMSMSSAVKIGERRAMVASVASGQFQLDRDPVAGPERPPGGLCPFGAGRDCG
ncbi:MAG: hypothetical protein RL268_3019 [Pseudomonadota bacterium]